MTIIADTPLAPTDRAAEPEFGALLFSPRVAFLLGALSFAMMQRAGAHDVWSSGRFLDTDDAMRLVQVREWMAGKAWGDFAVTRMGSAEAFHTHWSHLIDLPLAALVRLFSLGLDPIHAERATRLAFPFLCFCAALFVLIQLARRLVGPGGGLVVALLAPLSVFSAQFIPGRIDHHGPQLLLLATMIYALTRAFTPGQARWGALAGVAAAASLGISIENLPFIAAIAAICGAIVAFDPARARLSSAFGAAFALATPAVWAIFADRAIGPVCDALSTVHVALAGVGGLGLAALASLAPRLSLTLRLAGLAALAAAALALLRFGYPACLADPLAAVPPLAVEFWLSRVSEAKPWRVTLMSGQADYALAVAGPVALALLAQAVAAFRGLTPAGDDDHATARLRWLTLFALTAVGAAATLWQVRAGGSTLIPGVTGAAAAAALAAPLARRGGLSLLWPALACVPFAGLLWALVASSNAAPAKAAPDAAPARSTADCIAPSATAPLESLAPGLILTSIDPGSYLLAQTKHSALAGAYHRNAGGNVAALTALLGAPEAARDILRANHVDYVAVCPDLEDMRLYANLRPDSLAAALLSGQTPAGLEPVPLEGVWRVFRPR